MNDKKKHHLTLGGNAHDLRHGKKSQQGKSDIEIWKAFKRGDEAAFVFIYQQYFELLVNYCYQFTQNEDLIKDCVQDLFIFTRSKRESISVTDNIKLYLLRSCRNRLMSYLKKDLTHKSMDAVKGNMFVPVPSTEENIVNLQTRELREERLRMSIKKLSFKEREIIYYFYYQNMDYRSIAELMGYEHVKSARSLLYKALGKLKELFVIAVFMAAAESPAILPLLMYMIDSPGD